MIERIIIAILLALCISFVSFISCINWADFPSSYESGHYENNPVFNDDGSINYESLEYRYDVNPLNSSFKSLNNSIISACWKEYRWGNDRVPGPSCYRMAGFMKILPEEAERIENQFAFEPSDVDFADGIYPEDTGFSDFNWGYNEDFNKCIEAGTWIGSAYYDANNNIVYVDVGAK